MVMTRPELLWRLELEYDRARVPRNETLFGDIEPEVSATVPRLRPGISGWL